MGKFDSLSNYELYLLSDTVNYLDKWATETLDEFKVSFKKPNIKNQIIIARDSTTFFHSFLAPFDLHPIKCYISGDIYNALIKWQNELVCSFADFMDYYSMLLVLSRELKVLRSELEDYI